MDTTPPVDRLMPQAQPPRRFILGLLEPEDEPIFRPDTHGPAYLTTVPYDAFSAWEADDTHWILTNGTAYLVGYAPAIFRMGPMAQGWRITCPEECMAQALAE